MEKNDQHPSSMSLSQEINKYLATLVGRLFRQQIGRPFLMFNKPFCFLITSADLKPDFIGTGRGDYAQSIGITFYSPTTNDRDVRISYYDFEESFPITEEDLTPTEAKNLAYFRKENNLETKAKTTSEQT